MNISIFSAVYVVLSVGLFYCLRKGLREFILVGASLGYIYYLDSIACLTVMSVTAIVYVLGRLIGHFLERDSIAKSISAIGVIAIVLSLLIMKYFKNGSIMIPIGYSFYCFQGISYLVDVYEKKTKPVSNVLDFALYMLWFPKFISGPIERAEDFIPQIQKLQHIKFFEAERLKQAASYCMLGSFYKIVIADRLANWVSGPFGAPEEYCAPYLVIVTFMYTLQIYCDFAGYSMFAIGVSKLFGIELRENFNAPYMSQNINEFWARWHISLSSWLRDYVYIPLGGNRKGKNRKLLNILVVFLVSGMWHGSTKGFLIWGLLHGLYSIIDKLVEEKGISAIRQRFVGRFISFLEVNFAWVFFGIGSGKGTLHYFYNIVNNHNSTSLFEQFRSVGIFGRETYVVVGILVLMIVIDAAIYKYSLKNLVTKINLVAWCFIMWALILIVAIFGAYGPSYDVHNMIYMQF